MDKRVKEQADGGRTGRQTDISRDGPIDGRMERRDECPKCPKKVLPFCEKVLLVQTGGNHGEILL